MMMNRTIDYDDLHGPDGFLHDVHVGGLSMFIKNENMKTFEQISRTWNFP